MRASDVYPHLNGKTDDRERRTLTPCRVVAAYGNVTGAEALTIPHVQQVTLAPTMRERCFMTNGEEGEHAAVILDFGQEIHGTLTVAVHKTRCPDGPSIPLRIRLGESVGEALTPVGERGASNDHATRDFILNVNRYSANGTPETGFRFAYI